MVLSSTDWSDTQSTGFNVGSKRRFDVCNFFIWVGYFGQKSSLASVAQVRSAVYKYLTVLLGNLMFDTLASYTGGSWLSLALILLVPRKPG